MKAAEAQITIGLGNAEIMSGLQEKAKQDHFQLVTSPIYFQVNVMLNGEKKEVSSFSRGVEKIIYLPKGAAETASTAIVWDQKLGVRPVSTEFIEVDGHKAARIRSLTNDAYLLVSKTSELKDIQGHWASTEIAEMTRRMIVDGIDGNRFAPEAFITRAELAALLARGLGLTAGEDHKGFKDVSESRWYSSAVAAVQANGIMNGFIDGTFRPKHEVTRQEAIVTIVRALQLANAKSVTSEAVKQVDLAAYIDSNQIGYWASNAMRTAIMGGLVKGYGDELRPQKSLTRAETTVLIYRLLQKAELIES